MNAALEFLDRCFHLQGEGWSILFVMAGLTTWMIFSWIDHWQFRFVTAPGVVLGALVCHNVMSELGLHLTGDIAINQGVGFGIGMVTVAVVVCGSAWAYYEFLQG